MNEEYCKVIREFIPDFLSTFPEYEDTLDKGILDIIYKVDSEDSLIVYKHSVKYVAHHIIRILQQDQTLFDRLDTKSDTQSSTEYIKGIVFADLWYKDITEQTKDILWKYILYIRFHNKKLKIFKTLGAGNPRPSKMFLMLKIETGTGDTFSVTKDDLRQFIKLIFKNKNLKLPFLKELN